MAALSDPEASWTRAILMGFLSTGPAGAAAAEDDILRRWERRRAGEDVRKLEAGEAETIDRGQVRRWRNKEGRMAMRICTRI